MNDLLILAVFIVGFVAGLAAMWTWKNAAQEQSTADDWRVLPDGTYDDREQWM